MARPTLSDVHVKAVLNQISIAYKNDDYIAAQVFPQVTVNKQSDYYYTYSKDFWFRNRSGMRAPGGEAPRADYGLTTASYSCINDAMAKAIPDEVRDNADAVLAPDVEAVEFCRDALLLGLEDRVATIITASSGTWANAASPTTQWSSDTSDPWGDIMTGINTVIQAIGRMPNTAVLSYDVWRYLQNHPDFLDRVKYTRASGRLEEGDLRSWFGFGKVLIGMAIKDNAQEGRTASQVYVWDDDFWIGYVSPRPALRTPSAGYTFVWGTQELKTFREEGRHQDVVESQWFTDEVVTASDAGYCIYNAV